MLEIIKGMLGIEASEAVFDNDLQVFIMSAVASLRQIGLDIFDEDGKIINADNAKLNQMGIQYIYLKVKTAFDPTSSATITNSYDSQIEELATRIQWETNNTLY